MRVKDEMAWSAQASEFVLGDDLSVKFHDFLVFWCEAAEKIIAEEQQTPRDSLVQAFEIAEQTFGFLSVEWLGQMLLVIVQHWFDGDALWESLSVWERRLVEQATALKMVELQESARVAVEDETSADAPPS